MNLPDSPVLDQVTEPVSDAEPRLTPELEAAIDDSVRQFENKFGLMISWARSQGWIEEYRCEITRLVRMALKAQDGQE